MRVLVLLVTCGIATVLGQFNHAANSFAYQGCSSIDLSCFSSPVDLNGRPLAPELCQQACQGHRFAALFPTECRCGDDANAIKPLDESVCNVACNGDPSRGMCGSVCTVEGPGIANVYTKTDAASQQPQVLTLQATSTLTPSAVLTATEPCTSLEQSPATETEQPGSSMSPLGPAPEAPSEVSTATEPCTSLEQSPATETEQPGSSMSPLGPAPEAPSTFTFALTSSRAQTSAPLTTVPTSPGKLTTPCPLEGSSNLETPPEVTVPPATETSNEDPSGYTTSTNRASVSSAPENPTTTAPSMYTSETKPAPAPQTYSDPQMSGQQATETANSNSDQTPDVPTYLSASTLWPLPSDAVRPTGQPPVPVQVTGSDSTHGMIPPLATIGGLALIAAIIV
ncbi:hypothetical protein C2857_006638 [Epichloe festucae Fl1]|uniref:WSC domain-containing protein n=1 Tax=Epichloe festucae (strain Fl1) TaxID=877507 RepID=A0A7S9KTN2_EPIFF|nr:hypothetical protein C2857_006638 [Epichloe festucae Fl1]